jgi:hypothetical protein
MKAPMIARAWANDSKAMEPEALLLQRPHEALDHPVTAGKNI